MSNENYFETNEYNSEFKNSKNEVVKEKAYLLKKSKNDLDVKYTEQSSQILPEKERSVLDLDFPENVIQNELRNKLKKDIKNIQPNVVMLETKENNVNCDYDDLFTDDEIIQKKTQNKDFYKQINEGILRKEEKLVTLRNKKIEDEINLFKNRPKINKFSQKINEKNFLESKPIQNRAQEIVDKKYLKIDKLKQIYREIEDTECSKITSNTQYNEKKFEKWLNKQSKWESNKKSKINSTKEENERLETENMKSMYHPNIIKKPETLIKSKILTNNISIKGKNLASDSRKNKNSIHNKLYNLRDDKYNRIVQKIVENTLTFTPTININLPNFNKAKQYKNYNNKKYETQNNKKYLNNRKNQYNSVQNSRKKLGIINEENLKENENYDSAKNKGLNTSIVNSYYNPLNDLNSDEGEEEESDIISRYRKASERIFNNNSEKKQKTHNHSYQEDDNNGLSWQNSILNIDKKELNQPKIGLRNINLLYKINVRNSSAWDQNKENCIVYNPKTKKSVI